MRLFSRRRIHNEQSASKLSAVPENEKHEKERGAGRSACLGNANNANTPNETDNDGDNQQRRRGLKWFGSCSKNIVEEETCSATSEDVPVIQIATETEVDTKKPKQTRFDAVQVRTYEQILGDNPYISLPLGIGWKYNEDEPTPVEIYDEENHEQNENHVCAQDQEPMDLDERRARLRGVGYTESDIQQQECRRKVQIAMEWAYRYDHPDKDIPCTIPNAAQVIKKYVV